ncbi:hypothetical protein A0O28_0020590 [Trichoderma guizhouense]|uniref:SSCRP protein n=1 Tax=Trichoderma guizhouense TaxID=1491466 RepID=A0A1T3CRM8_9HYPO|nr:hypothetical protein A0O28_0020590 [Trichoderma guizhouense]
MKAHFFVNLLMSSMLCLVIGFAIPDVDVTIAHQLSYDDGSTDVNSTLAVRADDDEWQLVVYDKSAANGACEGASETIKGKSVSEKCYKFFTTHVECINFGVGNGLPYCDVKIKPNCGPGTVDQTVSVKGGENKNGVNVKDAGGGEITCGK